MIKMNRHANIKILIVTDLDGTLLDYSSHSDRFLFVRVGAHLPQIAVTSDPVIEDLDMVEDVGACLIPSAIDLSSDPLFLDAAQCLGEARLH